MSSRTGQPADLSVTLVRRSRAARDARATLAEGFDPRANSLNLLRLVLAAFVLLHHGVVLGGRPRGVGFGQVDLGQLGVDAFFVVSGFLVARSAIRLDSVGEFLWHRALRLLPGFWVCLLVTAFVVAPALAWLEGRSPGSVLTGDDNAVGFVVNNAALLIRQYGIGGLLAAAPEPGVLDGSLWSLYYEALCYLVVVALLATGVLRATGRTRHLTAVLTAAVWLSLLLDRMQPLPADQARSLLLPFLFGVLAHLYGDRLPVHRGLVAVAATTFLVAGLTSHDYAPFGGAGFAYLVLLAGTARPVLPQPGHDLSYGLYLYHWPVQRLLAGLGVADAAPLWLYVTCSLVVTLVPAAASWFMVERPAMRRRRWPPWAGGRGRSPRPA